MAGNGGGARLFGLDGKPIIGNKPHKIVVLKAPPGTPIDGRMVEMIAKATGCSVLVMPHESELLLGEMAVRSINAVHEGIHRLIKLEEEKNR